MTKLKQKTHKGAKGRFKFTATGKVMRPKGAKNHLRLKKSKRTQRKLDEWFVLKNGQSKTIRRLLPYG
ncbi:MAG TPA: 50S ribosomal protein L35 [Dehalococcoidia bacterium]